MPIAPLRCPRIWRPGPDDIPFWRRASFASAESGSPSTQPHQNAARSKSGRDGEEVGPATSRCEVVSVMPLQTPVQPRLTAGLGARDVRHGSHAAAQRLGPGRARPRWTFCASPSAAARSDQRGRATRRERSISGWAPRSASRKGPPTSSIVDLRRPGPQHAHPATATPRGRHRTPCPLAIRAGSRDPGRR